MAEPLADLPAGVSAQAGQVLRKIGERRAKVREYLTPFDGSDGRVKTMKEAA